MQPIPSIHFCVTGACEAYQHIGITLSGVCPAVCLYVCLSGNHTFLVVMHSYVSQGTHLFLGMLPLFLTYLLTFISDSGLMIHALWNIYFFIIGVNIVGQKGHCSDKISTQFSRFYKRTSENSMWLYCMVTKIWGFKGLLISQKLIMIL